MLIIFAVLLGRHHFILGLCFSVIHEVFVFLIHKNRGNNPANVFVSHICLKWMFLHLCHLSFIAI